VLKLHVGCGDVYFDGWVNIDREPGKSDLQVDLRSVFPYENDSVDYIYSEHVIEHFTVEEGLHILSECRRVLRKGGVLRIATPDLTYVVLRYFFLWKHQDWIKTFGFEWIRTKAEMLNIGMRSWGHQYLYNREELGRRLVESGFTTAYREKLNRSKYAELRNRETRKDSKLIMEAVK